MASTTKHQKTRVIISGAGPAGMVLALTLCQEYNDVFSVKVLEKRTFEQYFKDVGGGYDMSKSTARVMQDLKVTDAFEARSFQTPRFLMKDFSGKVVRDVPIPKSSGYRSMRRSQMQTVLYNAFKRHATHQVEKGQDHPATEEEVLEYLSQVLVFGSAVQQVEQFGMKASEEILVTTTEGKKLRCDILVGADGVSSAVRKSMQLPLLSGERSDPHYCGVYCWWGTTEPKTLVDDFKARGMQLENGAAMYIGHRNQIYLFTNQSGEMCWVILRQGKRGQFGNSYEPEHCKQQALEFAREHLGPSEADVLHLMELTPADRVSRVPLLDLDCLKTWYRGRCVVIGDAAHATTPFVGQGANMAIADAATLAHLLRAYHDRPLVAFQHLERLRMKMTHGVVMESRQIGDWMVGESKIKAWISKQMMKLAPPSYIVETFEKFDQPNLNTIAAGREEVRKVVAEASGNTSMLMR